MKRILFALFVILLIPLFVGCSSKEKINHIFDGYEMETTEKIPYVYYDNFIFGNTMIDFGEILDKNNCNGVFNEVYVLQGDTIWFGYAEVKTNKNDYSKWNIASINVNSNKFDICYSGEFCLANEADKVYLQNNNQLRKDYQTDNGFYYDGKIILTDHIKTVEYDLYTNNSTEFMATSYEYPTLSIQAEIVDYHTISFSKGNEQKIFNVKQGMKSSNIFKKMYQLEKKKNWQGKSYLSELFDKVQILENQIYIICRVINWDGETHAVVFQYDYDINSCKYAFHCFMDDVIRNNLYVVPTI